MSVKISGNLDTKNPADVYATHLGNLTKGGTHTKDSVAAMNSIPVERRTRMMLCIVADTGSGTPGLFWLNTPINPTPAQLADNNYWEIVPLGTSVEGVLQLLGFQNGAALTITDAVGSTGDTYIADVAGSGLDPAIFNNTAYNINVGDYLVHESGYWHVVPTGATSVTWDTLTGKPSTFPATAHQHIVADITDFPDLTGHLTDAIVATIITDLTDPLFLATVNAIKVYVGEEIADIVFPTVDLSNYYTKAETVALIDAIQGYTLYVSPSLVQLAIDVPSPNENEFAYIQGEYAMYKYVNVAWELQYTTSLPSNDESLWLNSDIETIPNLKAKGTISLSLNNYTVFRNTDDSNKLNVYKLVNSADVESLPETVRPDDYATSTNEKVWKLAIDATSIGGNDKAIQYNDNGVFAGVDDFTFDSAKKWLNMDATGTHTALPRWSITAGDNINTIGTGSGSLAWSAIFGDVFTFDDAGSNRSISNILSTGTGISITIANGAFGIYSSAFLGAELTIEPSLGGTNYQGSIIGGTYNTSRNGWQYVGGQRADVLGLGAFVHGQGENVNRLFSDGNWSINMSINTVASTFGEGANAANSAIIGGQDHHIPSDSLRSVILGGNALKMPAATTDTVLVENLMVNGNLTDIAGGDLFWKTSGTTTLTALTTIEVGNNGLNINAAPGAPLHNLQIDLDNNFTSEIDIAYYVSTTRQAGLRINSNRVLIDGSGSNTIEVGGDILITGEDARYAADYSGTYTALSLIDKGYADGAYIKTAGSSTLTGATTTNRIILPSDDAAGLVIEMNNPAGGFGGGEFATLTFSAVDTSNFGLRLINTGAGDGAKNPLFSYGGDYSGDYDARSLVDKGYVDSVIVTPVSGNGITVSGANINLGGSVTSNVTFTPTSPNTYSFSTGNGSNPLNLHQTYAKTHITYLDPTNDATIATYQIVANSASGDGNLLGLIDTTPVRINTVSTGFVIDDHIGGTNAQFSLYPASAFRLEWNDGTNLGQIWSTESSGYTVFTHKTGPSSGQIYLSNINEVGVGFAGVGSYLGFNGPPAGNWKMANSSNMFGWGGNFYDYIEGSSTKTTLTGSYYDKDATISEEWRSLGGAGLKMAFGNARVRFQFAPIATLGNQHLYENTVEFSATGATYASDYSGDHSSDPRWLIDKGFADAEYAALSGATFTGQILLPDGSVGAPALSFTNDTNAGLYWNSASNLLITAITGTGILATYATGMYPIHDNLRDLGKATANRFRNLYLNPAGSSTEDNILTVNTTTGLIEYRDASTLGGAGWELTGRTELTGATTIDRNEFAQTFEGTTSSGTGGHFTIKGTTITGTGTAAGDIILTGGVSSVSGVDGGNISITAGEAFTSATGGNLTLASGLGNPTDGSIFLNIATVKAIEIDEDFITIYETNGSSVFSEIDRSTSGKMSLFGPAPASYGAGTSNVLWLTNGSAGTAPTTGGGLIYSQSNNPMWMASGYATGGISLIENIGGQAIDTLIANPTVTQDGYVISWNDTNDEYELIASEAGWALTGTSLLTGTTEIDPNGNILKLGNPGTNKAWIEINDAGSSVSIKQDTNSNFLTFSGFGFATMYGGFSPGDHDTHLLGQTGARWINVFGSTITGRHVEADFSNNVLVVADNYAAKIEATLSHSTGASYNFALIQGDIDNSFGGNTGDAGYGLGVDLINLTLNDVTQFQVTKDGEIMSSAYGTGATTGTATYMIAVDASGNFIEEALPLGGEDYLVINSAGTLPLAAGADAIAMGEGAIAPTIDAIAIGHTADATGGDTIAIGADATTTITQAIAIGVDSTVDGQRGIALGIFTDAGGTGSIAIGYNSAASAQGSIMMGYNSAATQTNSTTDSFVLAWDGNAAFKILGGAARVNYLQIESHISGQKPEISVQGEATIGLQIRDSSSNLLLALNSIASSNSYFKMAQSASAAPELTVGGGVSNIDIRIVPLGTGNLIAVTDELVLGDSAETGTTRTISAAGSGANIGLTFEAKGSNNFTFTDNGVDLYIKGTSGSDFTIASGGNSGLDLILHGADSTGAGDGGEMLIRGGTTSSGTAGDVVIEGGEQTFSGTHGVVIINQAATEAAKFLDEGIQLSGDTTQVIKTGHLQLTQGQIQALNTTPIELIAAPGSGKYIEVIGASAFLDHNGTTYGAAQAMEFKYGPSSVSFRSSFSAVFINNTGDKPILLPEDTGKTSAPAMNTNVTVTADADATGNGGTIDVYVQYAIIDTN